MLLLLLLFLLFSLVPNSTSSPSLTDHYIFKSNLSQTPQEYFDPTYPLPNLPTSKCTQTVLTHSFSNTYNLPPTTVPYTPPTSPNCPAPWAHIILTLSVSSSGDQYDRIAAIWVGGVEILRTSTAEPTEAGVFWNVRKDVTKYGSIFKNENNVSMMLENIVNDEFTGVYHCNVTLEFYPLVDTGVYAGRRMSQEVLVMNKKRKKVRGGEDDVADLILPVSNESYENGHWFRVENKPSDVHSRSVVIPRNVYRAVLEVYVSFHGNDEFWYSNPPNEYIEKNNITTGRGNGAFRRVFPTIDGMVVGSIVPFPVIFTGGINPLFWTPVVGIGAFNLPSYDLDITPFLGILLDGKPHEFGLNVTDGISFWLLDANLHLWLDSELSTIEAKLTQYVAPHAYIARNSKFFHLNGTFRIDAVIMGHFSGWVNSSLGNLTTDISHKVKLSHSILFLGDGNYKEVNMKANMRMGGRIHNEQGLLLSLTVQKYKYPLTISTSNLANENNTYRMETKLSHTLQEESRSLFGDNRPSSKMLNATQDAYGWMLVQDHSVLSGFGGTEQTYEYKGNGICYNRKVIAMDGNILDDYQTAYCSP